MGNGERALTSNDAQAERVLLKLARHDIRPWALTSGLAFEIHSQRLGLDRFERPLNDLDFTTNLFDCIPETLSQDFLFCHIHPFTPPGKTLLQFIDRDAALRIDIFRACGETMQRAIHIDLTFGTMQIVSLEDLVTRAAGLLFDLANGVPVPSKHARDYIRFVEFASTGEMEVVWRDHKKATHPMTFREAKDALHELIPAKAGLLIKPQYSQDPNEVCPRCEPTRAFQLADPKDVLSLLGYC
jgi:hypothetical protein